MKRPAQESQRKGTGKRERMLRAARALFAEKGFAATTVSEIVRRAGVAQGTFYLYFPTKGDILKALEEEMRAERQAAVRPILDQERPLRELIDPMVRAVFSVAERYRDVLGMAEAEAILGRDMSHGGPSRTARFQQLEFMIRRDQDAGWMDPDLDPEITARLVAGVLQRAATDCFRGGMDVRVDRYMEQLISFLQRALDRSSSRVV